MSLPDHINDWEEAQTHGGRYSNASDYVRDLIRRDQERAAKIAHMQALVDEGLVSGPAEDFDIDSFLKDMREKHVG